MIWTILHIIEITLWIIISFSVFYVAFFAVISLFYEKEDRVAIHAQALYHRMGRFLILYPAYKEDRVIINAVEQFLLQKYPATHYTVAVISDHMQPETNEQLSKLPITLLTPAFEKSSKAKAMQYAINEVEGEFDNVVILDADNVVRPDFLDQLNVLSTIYDAIQCHRCAKNANNDVAVLDGASEEINNTLFRKAHNRLGLSSALIRMSFSSLLLVRIVRWKPSYSIRKSLSNMHLRFMSSMRRSAIRTISRSSVCAG